jgi:TPR repeat protein
MAWAHFTRNWLGVIQDYAKARAWYQKADDAGDKKAKEALQELARSWKKDPGTLSWLRSAPSPIVRGVVRKKRE